MIGARDTVKAMRVFFCSLAYFILQIAGVRSGWRSGHLVSTVIDRCVFAELFKSLR